jgi:hypothetical protein
MAAVSEIQLPTVELPTVDVPAFDMPNVDLGATVSAAAEAVGLRQPARRSRWLFAVGALIVGVAAVWGAMRNPQVRARAQQLLQSTRERISAMRPNAFDLDVGDPADPIAFPAAETKPIAPDPWNENHDTATPDYPDGLGSDAGDADASREESKSGV